MDEDRINVCGEDDDFNELHLQRQSLVRVVKMSVCKMLPTGKNDTYNLNLY